MVTEADREKAVRITNKGNSSSGFGGRVVTFGWGELRDLIAEAIANERKGIWLAAEQIAAERAHEYAVRADTELAAGNQSNADAWTNWMKGTERTRQAIHAAATIRQETKPSHSSVVIPGDSSSDADLPCPDPRCNDTLGAMPIPQCVTAVAWGEEAAKVADALRSLLNVIEVDELIPESVSYMRQAREVMKDWPEIPELPVPNSSLKAILEAKVESLTDANLKEKASQ